MTKQLHPRNIHNNGYDYDALSANYSALAPLVFNNEFGGVSVDFSDPEAVLTLNQALLSFHYKVNNWSIPKGNLSPPIPGRVDYLHYIADIISNDSDEGFPVGPSIKGLDIGTGAGCIYPILGSSVYGWRFVGTDINSDSINHSKAILKANPTLKKKIKLRFQESKDNIFHDIIKPDEFFDFTMCNPPFYSSEAEANKASNRKIKNLKLAKGRNFGGQDNELWCPGGELAFIKRMIEQSVEIKKHCNWFTTLVSNNKNLDELIVILKGLSCSDVRTIKMNQGNKTAHILAWRFS